MCTPDIPDLHERDDACADLANFEYQALARGRNQTRLVKILKARPSLSKDIRRTSICCEIQTYKLGEQNGVSKTVHAVDRSGAEHIYTAISYEWGKGNAPHEIILNGQSFGIRSNLLNCLLALAARGYDELEELYWIDQLCINQNDVTERTQQARLMGKIYAGAVQIITWLGSGGFDAARAFQLMEEKLREVCWLETREDPDPEHSCVNMSAEEMQCLNGLVELPYWDRVWIVQEVYLARRLALQYGRHRWSISTCLLESYRGRVAPGLIRSVRNIIESGNRAAAMKAGFVSPPGHVMRYERRRNAFLLLTMYGERLRELYSRKSKHRDTRSAYCTDEDLYRIFLTLDQAINLAVTRSCGDARDKVFGMQMCIHPKERILLEYTHSLKDILLQVVEMFERLREDPELPASRREYLGYGVWVLRSDLWNIGTLPSDLEKRVEALGRPIETTQCSSNTTSLRRLLDSRGLGDVNRKKRVRGWKR